MSGTRCAAPRTPAPDRVQPAGPGAPGRGAGRGRDRRVAGGDLGEGARLAAASGAWICFEDEAGQNLRPPKARTWARLGRIRAQVALACPVISFQTEKRSLIVARYPVAGSR